MRQGTARTGEEEAAEAAKVLAARHRKDKGNNESGMGEKVFGNTNNRKADNDLNVSIVHKAYGNNMPAGLIIEKITVAVIA